jgi:hypothetical protein
VRYFLLAILFYSCSVTKNPVTPPVIDTALVRPITQYYATFSATDKSVNMYQVRKSSNNRNWTLLTSILPKNTPDSSTYSFLLPATSTMYYYQILAVMTGGATYSSISIFSKTQ